MGVRNVEYKVTSETDRYRGTMMDVMFCQIRVIYLSC